LHLHDLIEFTDSGLVQLAALMAQLDLVITVDTLAAHLAGTLNIPCFLLLQHAADWRWMVNRADSPWYPSLRLFRQQRPQDWEGAVLEMSHSLAGWTCANCAETTAA
jgi:ADP-heptose:LPS heptosyltransferase